MKRKTWATVGGLAIASAVCATLLAADVATPATQPAATQPASQPTEKLNTVAKGSMDLHVTAEGVFQAVDPFEVKLRLKAYGGPLTIADIAAPGMPVKKGDVLLEIDPTHLNWAIAGAENEVAAAKAGLVKAEADLKLAEKVESLAMRQTEQAMSNAEAGLKWWQDVDSPQMLKSAELTVKQYKDMLTDQEDELEQLKKMYKSEELTNATADIVMKRALRRLDQVKIAVDFQVQRHDKFTAHEFPIYKQRVLDTVQVAGQQLTGLQTAQAHASVLRTTGLSGARIAVEQAEKKLRELKEDQALFRTVAPASGVVQYGDVRDGAWQGGDPRNLRAGEKVTSGATVMRVINPGKLCVELSVPDNKAFLLSPGLRARIAPTAFPGASYHGTCGPVMAVPRGNPPTVGFNMTVMVDENDARLLPGMKCSVHIEAGKAKDVLLIPLTAISDGQITIRNADGKTETRRFQAGRSDGKSVEVLSGLAEGDQLVLPEKK